MSGNTDFFPIERNRYFYGKLLTVRDFELEQQYARRKSALLNRISLGSGVVCGLGVSVSDDTTLLIESGMAIDYQGRMVIVEEPLLRKLQMLEGQEELLGKDTAYLCLRYQETDLEPVNAVGMDAGESRQFNVTRESSRLYLTTQPPEFRGLLEAQGRENVSVLYSSPELSLIFSAPERICAGQEFMAEILVVKNEKTPPVHFVLDAESTFVESADGRVHLEYRESPNEKRRVYTASFRLKACQMSGLDSPLFPKGGELDLELGSHRYKNYIEIGAQCVLYETREELSRQQALSDDLDRHLRGRDLPIYLAKLELINSAGSVFLASATNLPFRQRMEREQQAGGEGGLQTVTTSVRSTEYWQKPDVKAIYQQATGALHFDFGIPSPEQYDYAVSHGTVEMTMPGGLRVNSRVYSEEIPHGLGPGTVDIRLSLEFREKEETALCIGNSEVFHHKSAPASPPWAEVAALVSPERGTMRIGLWLHEVVEGNRLTVHYYAQKPERDADRLMASRPVSLTLSPEFARVTCRGTLRLQAEVLGSEDKAVTWRIREENGGAIDRNGIYQAPEIPGTYEIIATCRADESVSASAFVVVES